MKKYLTIVVAVLAVIFTLQLQPTNAALKEGIPEIFDLTIFSNNAGDAPNTSPFMVITFRNVPRKETARILEWKREIDTRIAKLGGVTKKEDYAKVMPIIMEYAPRFVSTGTTAFTVRLTIIREDYIFSEKKEPPVPAPQL
jgi:hypothetical protein